MTINWSARRPRRSKPERAAQLKPQPAGSLLLDHAEEIFWWLVRLRKIIIDHVVYADVRYSGEFGVDRTSFIMQSSGMTDPPSLPSRSFFIADVLKLLTDDLGLNEGRDYVVSIMHSAWSVDINMERFLTAAARTPVSSVECGPIITVSQQKRDVIDKLDRIVEGILSRPST